MAGGVELRSTCRARHAEGRQSCRARGFPGCPAASGRMSMLHEDIEALVARERPGWRVVEVIEVNDESGPSFEVRLEKGEEQLTLLVDQDEEIVAERR